MRVEVPLVQLLSNRFPLLLAALISWAPLAQAADANCDDARLKEALKPELNPDTVERDCERSTDLKFGRITLKDREGQSMTLSCCAAVRIQAYEGAEAFLEKKRRVCMEMQSAVPSGNCSGAHCLRRMKSFYDRAMRSNGELAAQAREARKIGRECRQAYRQIQARVGAETQKIANAVQRETTEEGKRRIREAPALPQ
jgi:hypothetical protein